MSSFNIVLIIIDFTVFVLLNAFIISNIPWLKLNYFENRPFEFIFLVLIFNTVLSSLVYILFL